MDAIILAGGYGTRLRPLTFSCPKSLIPFCNKPIIEHQISALVKSNVTRIIIAVSLPPIELMKNFIKKMEEKFSIDIILSIEDHPLGTGGPLALARSYIKSDTIFVLNSDVIASYNFNDLLKFQNSCKGLGTILTTKVDNPSKYGVILYNNDGLIESFVEKPKKFVGNFINAGIYCLNSDIINGLDIKKCSLENDIFPSLVSDRMLYSKPLNGFWMDIGQPHDYLLGTKLYLESENINTLIDNNSTIINRNLISQNTVIGRNCKIGANVIIENSVIMDKSEVKENTKIINSIIGWECHIGKDCLITDNSILEKDVTINDNLLIKGAVICSHKIITENIERHRIVL